MSSTVIRVPATTGLPIITAGSETIVGVSMLGPRPVSRRGACRAIGIPGTRHGRPGDHPHDVLSHARGAGHAPRGPRRHHAPWSPLADGQGRGVEECGGAESVPTISPR